MTSLFMYTAQERVDTRWIAMLSPPDRNRGGVSSYAKQGSGCMHVNDQGTIDSRLDARISIITLNRPAKLNALTSKMIFAFREALKAAQSDPGILVVLIRGEGRAFCAGDDIAELAGA